MQQTDVETKSRLVLRRTFAASRDRVFAAFTQADQLRLWMGPGEYAVVEAQADLRPGGAYRVTMQKAAGERVAVRGIYRDVRPPELVSYTWSWEEDAPEDEVETFVTIEFATSGTHTDVVLTQERFVSEESRDRHAGGWSTALDQLATLFAS
jgi:uncharacterized protein YndB with AHSA1/START domain